MDQDKLIRSLKLQLRIERTAIALAAVIFIVWWAIGNFAGRAYVITADEKPLACVATRTSAEHVITEVKGAVAGAKPADISFKESVEVKRAPADADAMSEAEAVKSILGKVTLRVNKYAILIGGKPAVAVDTEEDAGAVLEAAKARFGSMVKNLMEEPQFKEQVDVRRMPVDLGFYQPNIDEAVNDLFTAGGSGTYVVASGDVASKIAMRQGMSMSELESLNPGKNMAKLQIGEELHVSKSGGSDRPKLTVIVRNSETKTEPIPYTTESVSSVKLPAGKQTELSPGRNGLRQAVRATSYENGVRAGSEVVEETIIRNPVPRRVAVGIRTR
ncbi:MAG: G5 domain-containing protein [Armatimonadota bacterium]